MNKIFIIPFLILLLSFSVIGTTTDYDVEEDIQDFTTVVGGGHSYYNELISAYKNAVLFPPSKTYIEIRINASSIPVDATIDSATMYYYIDSYTATRRLTKTYNIFMPMGGVFLVSDKVYTSTGWNSQGFGATPLSKINRTTLTRFTISVPDVATFQYRHLNIRAKEYNVSGDYDTYDAYLRITYTEAGGDTVCTNLYDGGDFIVNEEVNCTDEIVNVDGRTIINQSLLRLENTNFTTNQSKQNILKSTAKIIGDELSKLL